MPTVKLPYGPGLLPVDIPDRNFAGVFSPKHIEPAADPAALVRDALASPIAAPRLRDAKLAGKRVAIVVDDRTRPTPVQAILPHVLDELHAAGAADDRIAIVLALGTHAHMTHETVERMKYAYHESLQHALDAVLAKHGPDVQIGVIHAAAEVFAFVKA